ncbi:hypothetical protein [Pararhodobacter zhoushanensis]|uniref:Uncharacterized protein n=1 Tax=Pararhodobacter zhoushanensis TaxID=2479545 RepID=A0ABT3GZX2_9RHOB|nr:hypothetical protein [Pararhodobacter zhoushanensis]MCW1933087.1 hypothetical protein [Pararhodobacter zhoushanensis]
MDRRLFTASAFATFLGGTGFGVVALSPRAAFGQRRDVNPIATVSVRSARFEATIYQGRTASEAYLMTRSGGREQWQVITLPSGAQQAAQVMLNEGGVTLTVGAGAASQDLQAAFRMRGADLQFTLSGGDSRFDGVVSPVPGAEPSDQFLGLIIAMIIGAILPFVFTHGMIAIDDYIQSRSRCRGVGCSMQYPPARYVPSPIR